MALAWMTALKVIPWSDVIDATPGIVKGARKLFARSLQAEPVAAPAAEAGSDLASRVAELETSLAQVTQQQKASAQLLETLAEQNARIVQAVDILRLRTRLLIGLSVVMAIALVALTVWMFVGVVR